MQEYREICWREYEQKFANPRLKGSCQEYTLPRSDQSFQVRGWIRGNTKIGPVLDVIVSYHQGCYGV